MTRERRNTRETWPLGPVTVLGAHILDVLGRPVEAIPPGQGSARLTEIGDDLLGDVVAIAMARHGVDASGLSSSRPAGT
jgi:hypothetical protein